MTFNSKKIKCHFSIHYFLIHGIMEKDKVGS